MKKIFLILLFTTSIFAQSSKMLLLMGDKVYNGTELITDVINRDFEVTSIYQSNFSSTTDGFNGVEIAVAGNIDNIGGFNDNLRLTVNTVNATHIAYKSLVTSAIWYYANLRVFAPAANTPTTSCYFLTNLGVEINYTLLTSDTWMTLKKRIKLTNAGVQIRIDPAIGTNLTYTDPGGDDLLYVREIGLSNSPQYDVAGNHSLDSSSVFKYAGSYSGKIVATGIGNGTTNTISLASALFTPVTSGKYYRFQIYAYTTTVNTTLTFKLGDIVKIATVSTNGMNVLNFDFKATASTTGNIFLYLNKAATVYIDSASFKSGQ